MDLGKALQSPQAYPFPVNSVKLIETHISWIFLTGDLAYKIKKPVKFSFLDFSTLKKRKKYCEKEVELNSRLAPKMYLGTVPITKESNTLKFEGTGNIIDYAVKMKQLPQSKKMDLLLERGKVKEKNIVDLAETIASFHSKIKVVKDKSYSSPEMLRKQFNDLSSVKKAVEKELGLGERIDFLIKKSNSFIEKNHSLLLKRQKKGFIRNCHGDLHSGNIFLMKKPIVFDCVEFNKDFRYTDTAADIGFMAMDLDSFKKRDFGKKFTKNYVEESSDPLLLKVLPFYKCYRANVRLKVNALRLMQGLTGIERKKTLKEVKKYIDLAGEYAETL